MNPWREKAILATSVTADASPDPSTRLGSQGSRVEVIGVTATGLLRAVSSKPSSSR